MAGTGKPFKAKGDGNGGWAVGAGMEGPGERQGGQAARDLGDPGGVTLMVCVWGALAWPGTTFCFCFQDPSCLPGAGSLAPTL